MEPITYIISTIPSVVELNNMSWGHATSTDLLHWTRLPVAMLPDEEGTIFSGCGLINEHKGMKFRQLLTATSIEIFPQGCTPVLLYRSRRQP